MRRLGPWGAVACLLVACDGGTAGDATAPSDGAPRDTAAPDDGDPTGPGGGDGTPDGASMDPDASPPDGGPADAVVVDPDAPPLFREGCPAPGRATARVIRDPGTRMEGPDALGGAGDVLLMNDRAAFIVLAPDRPKGWYTYGGIVVDAVALDGCRQAAMERFAELGLVLGRADLRDFPASVLRAFAGESVEIVDDGSGGEARVRVRGRDDYFWLIELELIRRVFEGGGGKMLSESLGLDWTVDYVLDPDSPVLRIELNLRNQTAEPRTFQAGAAIFFGDTTEPRAYARGALSIGGLDVRFGVPWLAAAGPDGALAVAYAGANAGTVHIAGVDALVDVDQFLRPPRLAPRGEAGDATTVTLLLSVGAGGVNTAVRPLHAFNPEPIPGEPYAPAPFAGRVTDAETGAPLEGVVVEVQRRGIGETWLPLDGFRTGPDGRYAGAVPRFRDPDEPFRLVAALDGRPSPEPVEFRVAETEGVDLALDPGGRLAYDVRDGEDRPLPAKILLWRGSRVAHRIYADGAPGERPLPPGRYEVTVTRGYEHAPWAGAIDIVAGETARLDVTLPRVVDTTGYLSYDGHVHAGPSPDSRVSVPDRLRTAAAEGLEVVVGTDHEIIRDWTPALEATGLGAWVATVVGQEVTATLPEHSNMYPVTPRPDLGPRGGIPRWYGMDIAELFAAERARGAGIVQLNHPRHGCNYLCLIAYDRLTGRPGIEDGTGLGFAPDAALWSWDFDTVEVMNGHRSPFMDPDRPDETGLFEDWQSFLNLGRRVTAVAVTDVHGFGPPGDPRTYFAAPTDDPTAFDEADLVDALLAGRAVISAGAFARVRTPDGATLGDTVTTVDGAVDLEVRVEALPAIDVTHVVVFANCDGVLTVPATEPGGVVKLDGTLTVPVDRDAHLVVAGFGRERLPRGLAQFDPTGVPRFLTNAIYVDADGDGRFTPPGGKPCRYTLTPP